AGRAPLPPPPPMRGGGKSPVERLAWGPAARYRRPSVTRNLLAFPIDALIAVPLSTAAAARNGRPWGTSSRGDLLVTFSGGGGGAYRFREPATGGLGLACRMPDTGYAETDSYSWSFSFIVPAGGGS